MITDGTRERICEAWWNWENENQRHNEPGSREPDVTQFTKNPVNSGRYEKHPTKKKRKKNSANRPTILFNQAKSGYREPLRR